MHAIVKMTKLIVKNLPLFYFFAVSSCGAPPADVKLAVSPVSNSQSAPGAALSVPPAATPTRLDVSGDFTASFHTEIAFERHLDETFTLKGDGTLEITELYSAEGALLKAPQRKHLTLSPAELQPLRDALGAEDFFALQDSYRGGMYDVGGYSIDVSAAGIKKRVAISGYRLPDAPPAFLAVVDLLRRYRGKGEL